MSSLAKGLPNRFPVGTRYVVEGRRGAKGQLLVYHRYVEFPEGRRVELSIGPQSRLRGSIRERPRLHKAPLVAERVRGSSSKASAPSCNGPGPRPGPLLNRPTRDKCSKPG
jgi:hypothetical protein